MALSGGSLSTGAGPTDVSSAVLPPARVQTYPRCAGLSPVARIGARPMGTTDVTAHAGPSVTRSPSDTMDQLCVSTIRALAMDAVQAANSGHPGTPMALAPVVYCLWQRVLRFDPSHPIWPNRDRFVLSVGHASMLLYAMLHLTGVKAVNPKYETLGRLSVSEREAPGGRARENRKFIQAPSPEIWSETISGGEEVLAR